MSAAARTALSSRTSLVVSTVALVGLTSGATALVVLTGTAAVVNPPSALAPRPAAEAPLPLDESVLVLPPVAPSAAAPRVRRPAVPVPAGRVDAIPVLFDGAGAVLGTSPVLRQIVATVTSGLQSDVLGPSSVVLDPVLSPLSEPVPPVGSDDATPRKLSVRTLDRTAYGVRVETGRAASAPRIEGGSRGDRLVASGTSKPVKKAQPAKSAKAGSAKAGSVKAGSAKAGSVKAGSAKAGSAKVARPAARATTRGR